MADMRKTIGLLRGLSGAFSDIQVLVASHTIGKLISSILAWHVAQAFSLPDAE